ncbi:MAG: hypothetical protein JXX14_21675 [Deltaproteobacteria bacterium]|nr:hypothetical protein [Deltaproteobacteria bacterium]
MSLRGTILQPWNWHTPQTDKTGLNLWNRLKRDASSIKKQGYTAVWLPPASEAQDNMNIGYGIRNWRNLCGYWGKESELIDACNALKNEGLQIYHDQVHNHLMGGNTEKDIWCLSVKKNNKNEPATDSCVWFNTDLPTDFPWLELNHNNFDAYHPNDWECWAISGKKFDKEAYEDAWGGCDLDFDSMDVVKKLEAFGNWYKQTVHVDGYRFDAVKHIRPKGTLNFLHAMRLSESRNLFAIGEFLHDNVQLLHNYISSTLGQISMFDVPLQRKFEKVSQQGRSYNLSSLFENTLTKDNPVLSVSFVHSHDDMPPMHNKNGRGHYIGDWFISQAYALTLLREQGYPMVSDVDVLRHGDMISRYMLLRQDCTYGHIMDKFDHSATIGWSFYGGNGYDNSMAVVLTTGDYGKKWLNTGRPNTTYRDFTEALQHKIVTNHDGWAEFECPAGNTSAWIEESKYVSLKDRLNSLS